MNRTDGFRKHAARWMTVAAAAAALAGLGCRAPREAPTWGEPMPIALPILAAGNMEVRWHTNVILEPGTALDRLWLVDGCLIGVGSNNRVYAVDARTGIRLWSERLAAAHERVFRPAVSDAVVWVPTTRYLWGIRGPSGQLVEKRDLEFSPATGAATNGIHLFIADVRGYLQAVPIVPETSPWVRWTPTMMTADPVADSTLVYYASHAGDISAALPDTRSGVWEHQAEGPVQADLKRSKTGLVLASSVDYSVYAFQGASGRLVWQFDASEPVRKPAYPSGGQVFVFTERAGLRALEESSGVVKWQLAEGLDFVAGDPETVYIRTRDDDLAALARADGAVQFAAPLRPDTLFAINETDDGVLYLATPSGTVMAVAKKKMQQP